MARAHRAGQRLHSRRQPIVHPLLIFWGGMFLGLIVVIGIALFGLLYPGLPVADSPRDRSLPVWSYGAVALCCAVGCMVVSQWLERDE
jgi:hypothetical protein